MYIANRNNGTDNTTANAIRYTGEKPVVPKLCSLETRVPELDRGVSPLKSNSENFSKFTEK
jgi:hypothetical protein